MIMTGRFLTAIIFVTTLCAIEDVDLGQPKVHAPEILDNSSLSNIVDNPKETLSVTLLDESVSGVSDLSKKTHDMFDHVKNQCAVCVSGVQAHHMLDQLKKRLAAGCSGIQFERFDNQAERCKLSMSFQYTPALIATLTTMFVARAYLKSHQASTLLFRFAGVCMLSEFAMYKSVQHCFSIADGINDATNIQESKKS